MTAKICCFPHPLLCWLISDEAPQATAPSTTPAGKCVHGGHEQS